MLASAAALGGVSAANAVAAPTVVSFNTPSRMIQSTGNLYWTQNVYNPASITPYESFVWRTSKTSNPGQEIPLYSQYRSTPSSLGDITYAQVGGTWYGYVVANYPDAVPAISRILRIPLAPPADPTKSAYILKDNLPPIGQNDLVTDGTNLYWADGSAIREMPIAGGTTRNLTPGLAPGTNLSHVGLDAANVFYTAGNQIMSVPKSGTPTSRVIETAAHGASMSAMNVVDHGTWDSLAYGETNGSVFEVGDDGGSWGTPDQSAAARPGVTITTVAQGSTGGTAWGECSAASCDIGYSVTTTPTSGTPVDLQMDGSSFYWGAAALFSMAIPPIIE